MRDGQSLLCSQCHGWPSPYNLTDRRRLRVRLPGNVSRNDEHGVRTLIRYDKDGNTYPSGHRIALQTRCLIGVPLGQALIGPFQASPRRVRWRTQRLERDLRAADSRERQGWEAWWGTVVNAFLDFRLLAHPAFVVGSPRLDVLKSSHQSTRLPGSDEERRLNAISSKVVFMVEVQVATRRLGAQTRPAGQRLRTRLLPRGCRRSTPGRKE